MKVHGGKESDAKGAVKGAAKGAAKGALGSYAVYQQIGALIGLGLLQSLSFGIMAPMMPIITTEVRWEEWREAFLSL